MNNSKLREEIIKKVAEYSKLTHKQFLPSDDPNRPKLNPEMDIPYSGRVFDEKEVVAAVSSCLDFWLTLGSEGYEFCNKLQKYLGVTKSILVNSGSSANLIAVASLTSNRIPPKNRCLPGDEIITCAAGFPTTVAPIIQNGLIPVFIDNDIQTSNAKIEDLYNAYKPEKTKGVIFAHTLGNPFDITEVLKFCKTYDLWLIEDNCDALGARYAIPLDLAKEFNLSNIIKYANDQTFENVFFETISNRKYINAPTGSFGDLSTQSFYPPHHITLGEGGAVNVTRNNYLVKIIESIRDWGRDCWCPSGVDNSCKKRFDWSLGQLPEGYDHKYTYKHLGYNLKPLDLQAAIGNHQLDKIERFVKIRNENWNYYKKRLSVLDQHLQFTEITHESIDYDAMEQDRSIAFPSWFGFMMLLKNESSNFRRRFVKYLDDCKIGNRMLFGGNLTRQPFLVDLKKQNPNAFRTVGDLKGADKIMNSAVFIGVYPGINEEMRKYVADKIIEFFGHETSIV